MFDRRLMGVSAIQDGAGVTVPGWWKESVGERSRNSLVIIAFGDSLSTFST
jgi:hypothetical protein